MLLFDNNPTATSPKHVQNHARLIQSQLSDRVNNEKHNWLSQIPSLEIEEFQL